GSGVSVAVGDGPCVAVSWGVAVVVGAVIAVASAAGVALARTNVLIVAVGRGCAAPASWKGVAPPKNASVATSAITSVTATAPSVSVLDGRHGSRGGGWSCGTRLPVMGAPVDRVNCGASIGGSTGIAVIRRI